MSSESLPDFLRKLSTGSLLILQDENSGALVLVSHDDLVKLKDLKFKDYFVSRGCQVLYVTTEYSKAIKSSGGPLPLGSLVDVTSLTIKTVGLKEHMEQIRDKVRDNIDIGDVTTLFSKGLVEEGRVRSLF